VVFSGTIASIHQIWVLKEGCCKLPSGGGCPKCFAVSLDGLCWHLKLFWGSDPHRGQTKQAAYKLQRLMLEALLWGEA